MKSPRAIVKMVGTGSLAACMLLVPWAGTVEAGQRVTKLTAADGAEDDRFGVSIAVLGNTVVIGASGADRWTGSAYIFERDPHHPRDWNQIAKLTEPDGAEDHKFGLSVAISGDTVVIGALGDEDLGMRSGSAYVFERDPSDPAEWNLSAKLTAADGAAEDTFGRSVAISGNTVVIGAWGDDDLGESSGSAYVFERDPDDARNWNQTAKVTAADGERGDDFGWSVAISGDTVLIGAYFDDVLDSNSGSAYIFQRDVLSSAKWNQIAKLTAADGEEDDFFGKSVAISGGTAVIGASGDDDLGYGSGAAYTFERDPLDPGRWSQTAKLTAAVDDLIGEFGHSVALSGDTVVIGAYLDGDLGQWSGSAYVFQRDPLDAGVWAQTAKLTAPDGAPGDTFGRAVAISGTTAVIGADQDDDLGVNSGSAYVYSLQGCELDLALETSRLRAGEELRVAVDLHHRRPITVTVPFLLWVEDAAGRVIVEKSSRPVTMEPGDHRQLRLAVRLPPSMPPGSYRVVVGVQRMQQGIAWASREFHVVE